MATSARAHRIGAKFRRQHPIGPFIVDFYCASSRLVVELDGGQHFEPGAMLDDERRTRWLSARGIRVLRFTNTEVPTLSPLARGEGDAFLRELLQIAATRCVGS